jgi:hypothetical protein
MRESTERVQRALRGDDAAEHLVAQRVLASPGSWHSWELEHSGLMRHIADCTVFRQQAVALRHTALRLIHGKALFEHLRKHSVRGADRARLLAHFHPTQIYAHAVVAEHAVYLRKACSFLCTSHLGMEVIRDGAFLDPMQHYETLYAEYLELFCATLVPRKDSNSAPAPALLPLLKQQLNEWRWIILNPKQGLPQLERESELRRPTGDTQRMQTLKSHKPGGKIN